MIRLSVGFDYFIFVCVCVCIIWRLFFKFIVQSVMDRCYSFLSLNLLCGLSLIDVTVSPCRLCLHISLLSSLFQLRLCQKCRISSTVHCRPFSQAKAEDWRLLHQPSCEKWVTLHTCVETNCLTHQSCLKGVSVYTVCKW